MAHWSKGAFFYHIYPLGYCGAPAWNDRASPPHPRLDEITSRLDSIAALGCNAVYLGPIFESASHGYDTLDWRHVDRRLGTDGDLGRLAGELHARGMRLVLDGVFGHASSSHPWFEDLRARGASSPFAGHFRGVDLTRPGPGGNAFNYECWEGHATLPRLDLGDPAVREELIGAVLSWIGRWDIDGLRLDAADTVDLGFQRELAARCRERKPDFWLMGEVIHGDYRTWTGLAGGAPLDSVTNYECWKGLWSSLADANYHEIDYALRRQSSPEGVDGGGGIYRHLDLYTFADNHDVDRVASKLPDPALLYPLYGLLLTMPGLPSVYYGSEFGLSAARSPWSDEALRPSIEAVEAALGSGQSAPEAGGSPAGEGLRRAIARLARLRARLPALREGGYESLHVAPRQLVFVRKSETGYAIVALNASDEAVGLDLALPFPDRSFRDELEAESRPGGEVFEAREGRLKLRLHPNWLRVLAPA